MARRKGKCRSMKHWIDETYGRGIITNVKKLPRTARKALKVLFNKDCK